MASLLLEIALWAAALLAGGMAGLYYAFSAFIMRSLAALPAPAGADAMRSINHWILRSSFLPLFFGSSVLSLILAVIGIFNLSAAWGAPAAFGGVVYAAGMFGVTVVVNVPLNDRLAAVDLTSPEAARLWALYLSRWTRWNTVRAAACLAACAAFIAALQAV